MNKLAYFHAQRLKFSARRLACDLQALRSDPALPKLYRELYESHQMRLSAVTAARRSFGQWMRKHVNATNAEVRQALRVMNIPITLPALRRAVRSIRAEARERIRNSVLNQAGNGGSRLH